MGNSGNGVQHQVTDHPSPNDTKGKRQPAQSIANDDLSEAQSTISSSNDDMISVHIRMFTNNIVLRLPRKTTIQEMARQTLNEAKLRNPPECLCKISFVFQGRPFRADGAHTLGDIVDRAAFGQTSTIFLDFVKRFTGGGLGNVWEQNGALQVGTVEADKSGNESRKSVFAIPTFHVSCRSDKIEGQDMIGFVLYMYDNQTLFYLNGMKCRSGYILLVSSDKLQNIKTKDGTMHSKAFKYFMKTDLHDMNIIGGGFAIRNGKPVFRSGTFNAATTKFHDGRREMHCLEEAYITLAIDNWKRGVQNTHVKDVQESEYCAPCAARRCN